MSRHADTRVRDAIEAWGLTVLLDLHGLGWPRVSTVGRIVDEWLVGAAIRPAPGPRVPRIYLPRQYWAVQRVLSLPDDADSDAIEAKFKNGVLKLRIPKHPARASSARVVEIERS